MKQVWRRGKVRDAVVVQAARGRAQVLYRCGRVWDGTVWKGCKQYSENQSQGGVLYKGTLL